MQDDIGWRVDPQNIYILSYSIQDLLSLLPNKTLPVSRQHILSLYGNLSLIVRDSLAIRHF